MGRLIGLLPLVIIAALSPQRAIAEHLREAGYQVAYACEEQDCLSPAGKLLAIRTDMIDVRCEEFTIVACRWGTKGSVNVENVNSAQIHPAVNQHSTGHWTLTS